MDIGEHPAFGSKLPTNGIKPRRLQEQHSGLCAKPVCARAVPWRVESGTGAASLQFPCTEGFHSSKVLYNKKINSIVTSIRQ